MPQSQKDRIEDSLTCQEILHVRRRLRPWTVLCFALVVAVPGYSADRDKDSSSSGDCPMNTELSCKSEAVDRSRRIIEAILRDVCATYPFEGGGGITQIRQDTTWGFTVSIAQEERVDTISYQIAPSPAGEITIEERKTGTQTQSHRR